MDTSIKLITLNIEGDRHLDRVIPFLQKENAHVVCLQEVLQSNVELLKKELQMFGEYEPTLAYKEPKDFKGLLTLTRMKPTAITKEYYAKAEGDIPVFTGNLEFNLNRLLMTIEIVKDDTPFKIINTHFTWTKDGMPNDTQRRDFGAMTKLLEKHGEFVLCGDFNMPRGLGLWDELAKMYKDNIPSNVITTLDENLHKVKSLRYVVDGMFSSKDYMVSDVNIFDGISDHKAVIGTVKLCHPDEGRDPLTQR